MSWDPELYEARHSFVWHYGEDLLKMLNPQPGERILDLGCGPGNLTQKIADSGASVLGLDSSPAMIGQARQNCPRLEFVLADAANLQFSNEFDAVFSNAALHWMLDTDAVAAGIARSLKRDGRFVAELGGKGNIARIEHAIEAVIKRHLNGHVPTRRTIFPSVAEYSTILEAQGLEVRTAHLFDRPTPLHGEDGMANWIRQFAWYYFEALPPEDRQGALEQTVEQLRPMLFREKGWTADYRRLRILAVKV